MNRSPALEETLVFIGNMRVSKADGSQVADMRGDALAMTGVAADQLDLDRASGKRDDWPGFPLQDDGTELRRAQASREKFVDLKLPDQGAEAPPQRLQQVVQTGFRRCDARGAM
jgi:hypothetical protein